MNIALTADWLTTFGGAEHVIAEFHRLWPHAPLFTTVAKKNALGPLANVDIRTSSLQIPYRILRTHPPLLPWMLRTIEDIDLRGFDVILSSCHAISKGIVPPSDTTHICYCHTPMRYAWEMEDQYLDDFKIPSFARKKIKNMLKVIRRWDLTSAKRVDVFIANSRTTQERIARTYARDSTVIHPPIDDRFFQRAVSGERLAESNNRNSYYFAVGRLVPYKRFDLLIETANAMKIPLKIAGTGKDFAKLKKMAGSTVEMLGYVSDEQLQKLYSNAQAFLFPAFEDAGIVPLEAQACGTPIIAFKKGGVLDTVKDGETGILFEEQTIDSLRDAIIRCNDARFNAIHIKHHAQQFSGKNFREKIKDIVIGCTHGTRARLT
jgi:glycosyltransferase involved in cell wall biosynthesis